MDQLDDEEDDDEVFAVSPGVANALADLVSPHNSEGEKNCGDCWPKLGFSAELDPPRALCNPCAKSASSNVSGAAPAKPALQRRSHEMGGFGRLARRIAGISIGLVRGKIFTGLCLGHGEKLH